MTKDDAIMSLREEQSARLAIASQHDALLSECRRLQADNAKLREALELAEATICRLKPPVPHDSTQGTRDVIRAALSTESFTVID